jgi:hypothetical protein
VQGAIYLVGCKSDLDIEVPTDKILAFAEANKVSYIQTSAKDDVGVGEAFRRIVEEAVQANLITMAFNKEEGQKPVVNELVANPPVKKTCC